MPTLRAPLRLLTLQIVAGCAAIVPLVLFGAYIARGLADAELGRAGERLMTEARVQSAEVDGEISSEIKRLQTLAASPSLQQGDVAAFQRQVEGSLPPGPGGGIALVDRNLREVINTVVPFGTSLKGAAADVEKALATGKPQFIGVFNGPVTREPLSAILLPVQIDGENRYVLVRLISTRVLAGQIAARQLAPGSQAVISDDAHRVIARFGYDDASVGTVLPQSQWPRETQGGAFEVTDSVQNPALEAYARSELTGWQTLVWQSKAALESPLRTLWRTFAWFALAAISLAIASALWLSRVIKGAVDHATCAATMIGRGCPLPAGRTPVAEVNALVAELGEASAKRQSFEAELLASEATFRSMFDVSSVGKVEIEFGTGRFLRVNDAMCELMGCSREELLQKTIYDVTPKIEHERDHELIRLRDSHESPVFDAEKRFIRKDGKEIWARVTANVVLDVSGRPVRCSVIQDLTARRQAEQALLASKNRLQLAFEATRLGWWQYDMRRRVLSGDDRANDILDLPENGMTIEEIYEKRVHRDDLQSIRLAFDAVDPVDPKPLSVQCRIQSHDNVRWVEIHGVADCEGAGPERRVAGLIGTVQDITERKESEEKEHLLIREINHRAKNMLSVVEAIARQTASRNPEDFIERFSERIQALSASQDLLVRNDWKGVEIVDLVRTHLAHFSDLIGSRIAIRDRQLRLNPAAAQAIGLALHELATNAGKYGALSTDRGCVDISWETDGNTFMMSWTEHGGPPVTAPKRYGFGSVVMEAMTARTVDGAIQHDYSPSGVTWRLTCAARNVLERGLA